MGIETEKVRENRLRRRLARRGYQLSKSRRRDTRAIDFGGYMILNDRNVAVAGATPRAFCLTLDDVERWLQD
jgi:hypothetical protein